MGLCVSYACYLCVFLFNYNLQSKGLTVDADISQVECCTGEEPPMVHVPVSHHHGRPLSSEWDPGQAHLSHHKGYLTEHDESHDAQVVYDECI